MYKKAYYIKTKKHLLGNGIDFVEVDDLYRYVILKNIRQIIGFDLKGLIKELISSGIERIENFDFVDLKLAWYLIDSSRKFSSINELCDFLKTSHYSELLSKTLDIIKKEGLENLFDLEKKIQKILAFMELEGISVDFEYLSSIEKKLKDEIDLLKKEMFGVIGFEFNPASTKDLRHVLFDVLRLTPIKKRKTGYSTDDETLNFLENQSDFVKLLKKFRNLSKLLSTYILGLKEWIADDGKIHTTFRQDVVATGRLSSINPNLQNLPSDEENGTMIRRIFVAGEGRCFVSFDYSQIDLRVLAHECEDPEMIRFFVEDRDIHESTARLIFGTDQITNEQRKFAKAINFGIVYGMEAYGLSKTLGISVEEASEFINLYFKKFAKVKDYFARIENELDNFGYVKTFMGRRRYFKSWKTASKYEKKALFREAINMPIQGGSADVIKMAMVKVYEYIKSNKLDIKLVLQIHDELVFIFPENYDEKILKDVSNIMESCVKLKVPLKVNYKSGISFKI
ncbi:MAG: DNA polymerase [Candidatus Dojkabacteria bacterium]|nr:DNA polymerase [Candidatus Dojkabacteria bacterium]